MSPELEDSVVQRVSELHYAVQELAKRIQDVLAAGEDVKRLEKRVLTCERLIQKVEGVQEDDRARLTSAIDVVRGHVTGIRGGRPARNREATELGERVLAAIQNPEQLAGFIAELQSIAGAPAQQPFGRTNSPV